MKKLALISVLFATMLSCSKDEIKEEVVKDCYCDRVVEVLTMNIVNGSGSVGVTKMYKYTTINDCTGIQRESSFSTQSVSVGQCK